ncbi:ATP-NAD kinase-like domain-containing protein [Blastocladiella britannica]|nr:ATP-NAD kinase-like domain-containing protein [Blastocladiella britannica]
MLFLPVSLVSPDSGARTPVTLVVKPSTSPTSALFPHDCEVRVLAGHDLDEGEDIANASAITTFPSAMVLGVRHLPASVPATAFPRTTSRLEPIAAHFPDLQPCTPSPSQQQQELGDAHDRAAESVRIAVFLLRHVEPRPVIDHRQSRLESWVFECKSADDAAGAIDQLATAFKLPTTRRLLLVINPFSGRKRGGRVAKSVVIPALRIAGTHLIDVVETTGPAHATELAQTTDIGRYEGAMLVGGDGIVHEYLNGFLARVDWTPALSRQVPIAHVAAGSGNGLAASFNAMCPARTVLSSLRGWTAPMDMMAMQMESTDPAVPAPPRKFLHLSFTWAYMADVNLEAEPLRWMGPIRFDVMAAVRLLASRAYGGRIAYLPALEDDGDEDADPVAVDDSGIAPSAVSAGSSSLPNDGNGPRTKWVHRPLAEILAPESNWKSLPAARYFYLTAHNVPHQTSKFNAAPHAHPHDGAFDVCLLDSDCNPAKLVPFLLDQTRGAHVGGPGVRYEKCRGLVIIPLHPDARPELWESHGPHHDAAPAGEDENGGETKPPVLATMSPETHRKWRATMPHGSMVADGEEATYAPVKIEAMPGLVSIFVPSDWNPTAFAQHAPARKWLAPLHRMKGHAGGAAGAEADANRPVAMAAADVAFGGTAIPVAAEESR